MANSFMHQGDLVYRIEQLEKMVLNRTSGRSLERSSIGAGGLRITDKGSLTIDGGELKMIAPNGVTVARWGDVFFGQASRGWEMNYADGSVGFLMGGPPNQQTIAMYDQVGNYVVTTDGLSRTGLARPYLNYNLVPGFNAEFTGTTVGSGWPSTPSTSYQQMLTGSNVIWHPRIRYRITTATAGGGTAEWDLRLDGNSIASGSGGVLGTINVPDWGDTVVPGHEGLFEVFLRCAGGATRAWVMVTGLWGTQS